jgi:hypothetical protein
MSRLLLALLVLATAWGMASAKSGPQLHTRQEIARAREQARSTDWGREKITALLGSRAGSYSSLTVGGCAEKPDQYFWDLMPSTKIPRAYYVHDRWKEAKGCPIHGKQIFKSGGQLGDWSFNVDAHPWKLRCPVGGELYPSNDFAAGDMTCGEFPDDGSGCKYHGDTYYFIAVYVHYLYLGHIRPMLSNLAQAYLLTGDPALGRKGAILLCKIAQEYPNATTKKDRTFHPGYANGGGMITDCDWSPGDLGALVEAYDSLYDACDDPECVGFIHSRRPELKTGADIRAYIEQELLRAGAQACMDGVILGNHGAREVAMTRLALVLDDYSERHPNSKDILDWVYYRAPAQIRYMASNLLLKDGGTTESPGYNTARLATVPIMQMVERIRALHPDQFPAHRYPIVFQHPKYRAMFDYFTDMVCIERYIPVIGDVGGGTPDKPAQPKSLNYGYLGGYSLEAFRQYADPKFAQVAAYGGFLPTGPEFFADMELANRAREAAEKAGPHILPPSQVMDGYKLAILRDGAGEDQRALWAFYGSTLTHGQGDYMQIGLFAKGLDLLPGIGYPQSWKDADAWEAHALTHNTVSVDQSNPGGDMGRLLGFVTTPLAQWMQVEKERVAPQVSAYRRTMALIPVSEKDCYGVDLFEVRGGGEHHLSYHGPQAQITTSGLTLESQERGTLAGEDVAFGQEYKDAAGRTRRDAFCLMTNVQRATPARPWAVDYAAGDERDVHVRLHGVPEAGTEVILADGRGATHPEYYTVKFVLAHRLGEAPLASQFVTVVEPYEREPFIKSIRRVDLPAARAGFAPVVLEIETNAGTDTIVFSQDPNRSLLVPDGVQVQGRFALVRRRGSQPVAACLMGGRRLSAGAVMLKLGSAAAAGKILAVERGKCMVDLDLKTLDPPSLVGRTIRLYNDLRSSIYTITAAQRTRRGTRLTLNTTSLIGEGVAKSVDDFVVHNPVLMFYGGLAVNADGTRTRGHSLYVGATLENESGTIALPVEGVTGGGYWGSPGDVWIDRARAPQATAAFLRAALTDANGDGDAGFALYDYGVGDRYEILEWGYRSAKARQ